jgi:hypothetical protein
MASLLGRPAFLGLSLRSFIDVFKFFISLFHWRYLLVNPMSAARNFAVGGLMA